MSEQVVARSPKEMNAQDCHYELLLAARHLDFVHMTKGDLRDMVPDRRRQMGLVDNRKDVVVTSNPIRHEPSIFDNKDAVLFTAGESQ